MSRIEEMIRELCPYGVEYKALGEIGTFVRGNGLQKKDFTDDGVGCIHYGQIYTSYNLFTFTTKTCVSSELAKKLKKAKLFNYSTLISTPCLSGVNCVEVCYS